MGLRSLDVCRRLILTSKVDPGAIKVKNISNGIGIQMNQKELTKTFMMISN